MTFSIRENRRDCLGEQTAVVASSMGFAEDVFQANTLPETAGVPLTKSFYLGVQSNGKRGGSSETKYCDSS